MKVKRLFSTLIVITALLLNFISTPASAELGISKYPIQLLPDSSPNLEKIEPILLEALSNSSQEGAGSTALLATADFFIWLVDQADVSPAKEFYSKTEKGQFVFQALRKTAERSQPPVLAEMDRRGVVYRSFYIANVILVRNGDLPLALTLAARPDVRRITGNSPYQLPQPTLEAVGPDYPADIESNITFIHADDAWALGFTGQGTVLAVIDTGLQWDHPAIIGQYRGWDGVTEDHDYNWWDATGQYPNEPMDGNGHGTMVTGVMVGDDGVDDQIGVAPGAKTIHCKAINDGGGGTLEDFMECFQWILAPWDLSGANPRPDLAPDAVTNSWGAYGEYGFEGIIDALQMAGILVEASVGGQGPGCSTLVSPADYAQVLSTGGIDQTEGVLPGTIAPFSARGPSLQDPMAFIPDVMAPSIDIRSSFPVDGYQVWSGTAVAGAHVTGLVGLIWSANPILRGNIYDTSQIIYDTAVPLTGQMGSNCGGDYETGPNNDWGYGTIDALAAVEQAQMYGSAGTLQGSVTDSTTSAPLADVEILADGVMDWITSTNSLGLYSMVVPSGTYTVSASQAGYDTEVITGVVTLYGEVTPLDFILTPIQVTISGTVTDENTYAPLLAEVQVNGGSITTTFTNPATGAYSLTLAVNHTYTLTALSPGYGYIEVVTGILTGNLSQDFNLPAGWLSVNPPAFEFELSSGASLTTPITLTNIGGLWLTFELDSPVEWLAAFPATGILGESSTIVLMLLVDTIGLAAPGVYTTSLILETDTPYSPISLPVRFTVNARYTIYLPGIIFPAEAGSK